MRSFRSSEKSNNNPHEWHLNKLWHTERCKSFGCTTTKNKKKILKCFLQQWKVILTGQEKQSRFGRERSCIGQVFINCRWEYLKVTFLGCISSLPLNLKHSIACITWQSVAAWWSADSAWKTISFQRDAAWTTNVLDIVKTPWRVSSKIESLTQICHVTTNFYMAHMIISSEKKKRTAVLTFSLAWSPFPFRLKNDNTESQTLA